MDLADPEPSFRKASFKGDWHQYLGSLIKPNLKGKGLQSFLCQPLRSPGFFAPHFYLSRS